MALEKSQLDSVFEICLPGNKKCLHELKKINQLDIMTLDELLDGYETSIEVPTTDDSVHELAEMMSEKLGNNCIRYKSNYEKYQNVDNQYIYLIIIELLGKRYGIDISKYTYSSDDESDDESGEDSEGDDESKEEDEIDEKEINAFIYKFIDIDIDELRQLHKTTLHKKKLSTKSRYNLLRELAEYNILHRESLDDPCEYKQDIHYDIIVAVDKQIDNLYRNHTLALKIQEEYDGDEQNELLEPLRYDTILDRIHGFLIMKYGGCNTFASSYPPPNIIQLSVVCTSTKPFSDKKAIGVYLIGTFLLISKIRNFDLVVLEVANDCVGGDDDDDDDKDQYGDVSYYLGKNNQKALYCLYERFGFREDPKFNLKYNCFSSDPFPSMVLDLRTVNVQCISSIILDRRLWSKSPSEYCRDGFFIPDTNSISKLCD